ncbi:MAG: hypothetical protein LRY52_00115 [Sulfurospirillum cavolei]|nr:hypothetical protein [Sulfurospirillum cavolei]
MNDFPNKEAFLKKIYIGENIKPYYLEQMVKAKVPLILYGASGYARTVKLLLQTYDITVEAICIDEKYKKNIPKFWENIKIYSFEELSEYFPQYDVIIGFSKYKEAEKKLVNKKGCRNIYFLDST